MCPCLRLLEPLCSGSRLARFVYDVTARVPISSGACPVPQLMCRSLQHGACTLSSMQGSPSLPAGCGVVGGEVGRGSSQAGFQAPGGRRPPGLQRKRLTIGGDVPRLEKWAQPHHAQRQAQHLGLVVPRFLLAVSCRRPQSLWLSWRRLGRARRIELCQQRPDLEVAHAQMLALAASMGGVAFLRHAIVHGRRGHRRRKVRLDLLSGDHPGSTGQQVSARPPCLDKQHAFQSAWTMTAT